MIGELSEELKGEQQIFRNLMSEKDVTKLVIATVVLFY